MTDIEREAYLSLADELSVVGATLADFDPFYIAAACRLSIKLDLPWPPYPDLDIALDLVERAEGNER